MYFNVFEAAPDNERDGPTQQAAQNAGGKVCFSPIFIITSIITKLHQLPEYFL
jgi:serine/threonine-protein phosphatase PPG1